MTLPAGTFTVAVRPLQIEGNDAEGNAKAERFRTRVMTANEVARKALFATGAMETPAALDVLIKVADALRAENFARGLEGVSVMGIRQTAHSLISMRYAGYPQARAVIGGLARNGDPMDKMMAEIQLRTMDTKAEMEKARQNPQPAR